MVNQISKLILRVTARNPSSGPQPCLLLPVRPSLSTDYSVVISFPFSFTFLSLIKADAGAGWPAVWEQERGRRLHVLSPRRHGKPRGAAAHQGPRRAAEMGSIGDFGGQARRAELLGRASERWVLACIFS